MTRFHVRVAASLFLAVSALSILACGGGGSGKTTVYGDADDVRTELDASINVEKVVKAHLKYPRDATFGWNAFPKKNEHGISVGSGTVKAANSFGAKLTHEYVVGLVLEDDGWHAISVVIDGELIAGDAGRIHSLSEKKRVGKSSASGSASDDVGKKPPASLFPDGPPAARPPERSLGELLEPSYRPKADPALTSERPPPPAPRKRTSSDGSFSTEAEFAGAIGMQVKLKKTDGTVVTVSFDQLSDADRDWIRQLARAKGG